MTTKIKNDHPIIVLAVAVRGRCRCVVWRVWFGGAWRRNNLGPR